MFCFGITRSGEKGRAHRDQREPLGSNQYSRNPFQQQLAVTRHAAQ